MQDLRYGENPHQPASWEPNPLIGWKLHQGKELSYTNILDLNTAARIALEFEEPASVVIKHTNPCGVAVSGTIADAYVRARDADAKSAFGSIVGLNRPIDRETAEKLIDSFIECVIAPQIGSTALAILGTRKNMRVITVDFGALRWTLLNEQDIQRLLIGTLMQQRDVVTEAHKPWPYRNEENPNEEYPKVVTMRAPSSTEWQALRFAWRICAHVKSNSVIFTGKDVTEGIGGGQPNRDNSAKIGRGFLDVEFEKESGKFVGPEPMRRGTVAASDAFFPFRDGLDQVANAGATAVVQPGGSVRDQEVIAAANEHNVAMVFTGFRHFRH